MKTQKMNNNTSLSSYIFGWFIMIFGSLTLTEWAVVVGMVSTIGGLLITFYYQRRRDKREEREHYERLKKL